MFKLILVTTNKKHPSFNLKDRYDNFYTKVFGTQEVKMVSSYPKKEENAER